MSPRCAVKGNLAAQALQKGKAAGKLSVLIKRAFAPGIPVFKGVQTDQMPFIKQSFNYLRVFGGFFGDYKKRRPYIVLLKCIQYTIGIPRIGPIVK